MTPLTFSLNHLKTVSRICMCPFKPRNRDNLLFWKWRARTPPACTATSSLWSHNVKMSGAPRSMENQHSKKKMSLSLMRHRISSRTRSSTKSPMELIMLTQQVIYKKLTQSLAKNRMNPRLKKPNPNQLLRRLKLILLWQKTRSRMLRYQRIK